MDNIKLVEKKQYSLDDYRVTNKLKTLEDAIRYFENNVRDGVECPCCKRFTKEYKRKLNSGMAYGLILIYKISKNDNYIHITDKNFPPIALEYSKLKHWGLLENKEKTDDDDEKNSSGYWRITDSGRKFVENKIKVKARIRLLNGNFQGFDGNDISIIDALRNKFDYKELMSQ